MTKTFITTAFLIFTTLQVFSQGVTLNIGGTVSSESKSKLSGATVHVTRDGKTFTSFPTSFEGTYYLYLPLGSEYMVNVSKKGYVNKFFTVNTKGVAKENAKGKFNVMVADVELLDFYEGVDYSVFKQPMNKYFYSTEKDNFEFDEDYLNTMLALVEEVKIANRRAIQLTFEKVAQGKKDSVLAIQKAMNDERLAMEQLTLKALDQELQASKVAVKTVTKTPASEVKATILVTDALKINQNTNERIVALLIKYKPGVTEEIIQGNGVIIIQRVVVRNEMAWVYQKKIFSWGGVACFRDGQSIHESTFELETKKTS